MLLQLTEEKFGTWIISDNIIDLLLWPNFAQDALPVWDPRCILGITLVCPRYALQLYCTAALSNYIDRY